MTWLDMTWHDMTSDRKCMHYAPLHIYCASVLSLDGRWSSLGKTSSGSHSVRITSTCTMGGMDRPTNTMQRYAKIDNMFYMFTKRKKIDLQKKSKDISRYPNGLWSIPAADLVGLRPLRLRFGVTDSLRPRLKCRAVTAVTRGVAQLSCSL